MHTANVIQLFNIIILLYCKNSFSHKKQQLMNNIRPSVTVWSCTENPAIYWVYQLTWTHGQCWLNIYVCRTLPAELRAYTNRTSADISMSIYQYLVFLHGCCCGYSCWEISGECTCSCWIWLPYWLAAQFYSTY